MEKDIGGAEHSSVFHKASFLDARRMNLEKKYATVMSGFPPPTLKARRQ